MVQILLFWSSWKGDKACGDRADHNYKVYNTRAVPLELPLLCLLLVPRDWAAKTKETVTQVTAQKKVRARKTIIIISVESPSTHTAETVSLQSWLLELYQTTQTVLICNYEWVIYCTLRALQIKLKKRVCRKLSVNVSISFYVYCYWRKFRLCYSTSHLPFTCHFQVFQLPRKGWKIWVLMLWVMAQNIPPKSFPLENTKNLSLSTTVRVPHFRNAQNIKYTQRWAGDSSQNQWGQPTTTQRRLRKMRQNFKFHKTTCQSVCGQPGSLHTSHEFPACCCRPFWQGKDPLFDTLLSVSLGCRFPQGAHHCMHHLPCLNPPLQY